MNKMYCKHCGKEIIKKEYFNVYFHIYGMWHSCDPTKIIDDTTYAELDEVRLRDYNIEQILN